MWHKSLILFLLFTLNSLISQCQITDFLEKFELPNAVEETSGLLFLEGKIITHNDSGDYANLYEIDSLSGNLLRTIRINNASNVDWEDLASDDTYIYIGDFGNNNGTRTDLKIYRILKSQFKENTNISANIISFSYEDQSNFNSSNEHNFDAEAFVIYHDSILIFTKNRGDYKTNVYKIPKTIGNHTAIKTSTTNVNGLITGATYNKNDDSFFLCGYDSYLIPFLISVNQNRMPGDDIFFSGFQKTSLYSELGQGSQVEGITHVELGKYYISRELYSTTFSGITFAFSQKLYQFTDPNQPILSTLKNDIETLKIYPNPTSDKLYINSKKEVQNISIYNVYGEKISTFNSYQKELYISHLSKGVYILRIQFENKKNVLKKFIKL